MSTLPPLYLLDTNVLVHLIRGDAVWQRVRAGYQPLLIDPRPLISVITAGELRSLAVQLDLGKTMSGWRRRRQSPALVC